LDTVFIKDLRIETIIGVHPWERQMTQVVLLDLDLGTDVARAARDDDVADALDYEVVAKRVTAFVQEGKFQLIETLADRTAAMLIAEFGVMWLRVTVYKPGALSGAKSVGIRVERTRI
jgi:dihydroneopterin aldolase